MTILITNKPRTKTPKITKNGKLVLPRATVTVQGGTVYAPVQGFLCFLDSNTGETVGLCPNLNTTSTPDGTYEIVDCTTNSAIVIKACY